MKRTAHSFGENFALALGSIIFLALFLLSFLVYSGYQNRQFEYMEKENQTAQILWQSQRIQTDLARIEGQLRAISDMVAASGFAPENDWFHNYLANFNVDHRYRLEYRSRRMLDQEMDSGTLSDDMRESHKRLMNGEQSISNIFYFSELEAYYFVIEEPVSMFGKVVGILRCMVPASSLVQQDASSSFLFPESQYIVDGDGKVLYSSGQWDMTGMDLLETLKTEQIRQENLDLVGAALQGAENAAVPLEGEAGDYMLTCASLDYRGWSLVQLVKNGNLKAVSGNLMKGTVFLGVLFVVMTGCAAYMVYGIIGKKNLRLEYEKANYESLARVLDTIIFEYVPKTGRLSLSANSSQLLDLEQCEIGDVRKAPLSVVHPEDLEAFLGLLDEPEPGVMEIRLRSKSGEWLWYECQVQPTMPTAPGRPAEIFAGRIISINKRKLRELQLVKESTADPLTGLMNRAAARDAIERILEMTPNGFLFMVDIDNFKEVNDTKGHMEGDTVLCSVAETLRNSFRGHDPVGRFGGDEFVAYMADCDIREQAWAKAEFITRKLSELSEGIQVQVSVSIGIAASPRDGGDFPTLLKKADEALYKAKQKGKNCYCFFGEDGQQEMAGGMETDG